MSNGLQQVINYMIPAVGTPRAYFWSGVLTGSPVTIDFRNISGGGIDGQVFRPSGVFIDNTQGLGNVSITVNEISYQMICLPGELLNLQFPAPIDCTVSFVGNGQATIAFVDFPVLPYRNLASGGMANPMTTLGDMIIGGVAGDATRLPIGTNGEVLMVVAGVPAWVPDTGGAPAFADITGDAFDNTNLGDYLNELFQDKLAKPGTNGIVVRTSAGGVASRMLVETAGKVSITNPDGVAGNPVFTLPDIINQNGIKFPAVQVPSADVNTLDDYEESNWTPVITFATPGDLAVTYSTQLGRRTKIGRQVFLEFKIATSSFTHTSAAGALRIGGLTDASVFNGSGSMTFSGVTVAGYQMYLPYLNAGDAFMLMQAMGTAVPNAPIGAADCPSGGTMIFHGSITYTV